MLMDGLIEAADLDPCGRRLPCVLGAESVLVCLVPNDSSVALRLEELGLPVSDSDAAGIEVLSSDVLRQHLGAVGVDEVLGLSGHPPVRPETAASARLYRLGDRQLAFLPAVLEEGTFYLSHDPRHLVDSVVNELHLLQRHWQGPGSPLLLIPVQASLLERGDTHLLALTERLRSGCVEDVRVEFANLETLAARAQWHDLPGSPRTSSLTAAASARQLLRASTDLSDLTAAQEQELDDTSLEELRRRIWSSNSLREQAEVLELLTRRLGSAAILSGPQGSPVEIKTLLEEIYRRGLQQEDWNVARRCAGAMGLIHPQLDDALIDLLSRQKQVVVGRNYTKASRLSTPVSSQAIAALIEQTSGSDSREWMLQQELLLALDGIARREPDMIRGSLTFQLGQLMLLLTSELASERQLSQDEAFEAVCDEPPHRLGHRLRTVLEDVDHARDALQRRELLHVRGQVQWSVPEPLETGPGGNDWLQHRIRLGSLQQVPKEFYAGIWSLLHHCRGLVIGDKLERRNRLTSALLLEKTPGERNFAIQVEHLLSRITAPEYRQLCTETLLSLMAFATANPRIQIDDDIALDVVIGHAVRVGWHATHPDLTEADYAPHKASAWDQFYRSSPALCRHWQIEAMRQLADQDTLN